MRSKLIAALLMGAILSSAHAAPPKKAPKPAPAKAPADVPAAGASGELLDLTTGRSRAIGAMQESRTDFQATAFPDGRVLITGGSLRGGTTEWFDPATRRFTPGPPMAQARQGHRAQLLKSGRLLVLGGTEASAPAEILEPGATKFQPVPGDLKCGLSAEIVDLDETTLFIDGQTGACWVWDGKIKAPKSCGNLNNPRILFRALRLADGRALVTGGWPAPPQPETRRGFRRPASSKSLPPPNLPVEIFNPKKGRWTAWKANLAPRAHHQMAQLKDGRVVLLGGFAASAEATADTVEILDPAKETVTSGGTLPAAECAAPGWADLSGTGLYLPERSTQPRKVADLADFSSGGNSPWRLANAYLAPALVPLKDAQLLVLGSAVWGSTLERWDPRTRQCQYLGALRAGTEALALLDGKVVALGPIVDAIDPKTGTLTPLGRMEEMTPALKKAKAYAGSAKLGLPPFVIGQTLKNSLVVSLDPQKALVLGGLSEASAQTTDAVWVWDLKKKTLTPSGPMKAKRAFPETPKPGEGALKLPDGSVLIWSAQ
ncbi:MAG: hypothetical protein IPN59_00285 [Holophaga sp.]|nr:hypothetical protein [Holophaga sp.]